MDRPHVFNCWWGCTRVSPACNHCYAETFAARYKHDVWGKNAPRRVIGEHTWNDPRRWNRKAAEAGRRELVFCASMADVFEDHDGPMVDAHGELVEGRSIAGERAALWDLIYDTPNLTWQLLTKRPENVLRMVPSAWAEDPVCCWPDNVWIGTTVEDQARADERLPILVTIPAPVLFLSVEPLLGPVDLDAWLRPDAGGCNCGPGGLNGLHEPYCGMDPPMVDWVIVGGESGPGCRPMDLNAARSVIAQCRRAGVAPWFKQVGGNVRIEGVPGGDRLDGEIIHEHPRAFVRETGATA